MTSPEDVTKILVSIAELRGELRGYAERTAATEQKVAELDSRLRGAATDADVRALDERVRLQEARAVVTPAGLLASLTAAVTVCGGLVALIQRIA